MPEKIKQMDLVMTWLITTVMLLQKNLMSMLLMSKTLQEL